MSGKSLVQSVMFWTGEFIEFTAIERERNKTAPLSFIKTTVGWGYIYISNFCCWIFQSLPLNWWWKKMKQTKQYKNQQYEIKWNMCRIDSETTKLPNITYLPTFPPLPPHSSQPEDNTKFGSYNKLVFLYGMVHLLNTIHGNENWMNNQKQNVMKSPRFDFDCCNFYYRVANYFFTTKWIRINAKKQQKYSWIYYFFSTLCTFKSM